MANDLKHLELSQKVGDALGIKRTIPKMRYDGYPHSYMHPNFAEDMNSAWVLVDALEKQSIYTEVSNGYLASKQTGMARITMYTKEKSVITEIWGGYLDPHTPTAILKAAAKALGVLND
jgi:hypothetical protein